MSLPSVFILLSFHVAIRVCSVAVGGKYGVSVNVQIREVC